ncbi:arsenate reductase [Thauera sp. 27]|uniref:Spx/MgsR family RNA polymerase-binding regulatory protein n=1 Tax=Thauera sp. 27 TaxID=305700 RepID=UPI0002CEAC1E|nr:Spx/MgsR family RNA polymerase-binding regulatory protein [Thauera sp. 27]ENO77744.1 arsenate reductase [Thauera sp. 27]
MKPIIHGIKNCDTMKKTFAWFDGEGIAYALHDYKKVGIDTATLTRWCDRLGWKTLVNTRGTTWRKLSAEQQALADTAAAIALMQAQPSLIRRPVVEFADGELVVGLDTAAFERLARR